MQHAGRWTGKASRRWIIQHVGRCTEAGQEKDRAACPQMYKGKAGDGSCSMLADGQRQGRDGQEKQDRRWNRQPADR